MGRKKNRQSRVRNLRSEGEDSEAMLEILIAESQEDEGAAGDKFARQNFFSGLREDSESDCELQDIIPEAENFPIKIEQLGDFPKITACQIPPEPKWEEEKKTLKQQVVTLKTTLEEKKLKIKELLQERDTYVFQSQDQESLHRRLEQAADIIAALQEKLQHRKEKYHQRLEDAQKFIAEKENLKKAEIFAMHKQQEYQQMIDKLKPTYSQNKALVKENERIKAGSDIALQKVKAAEEREREMVAELEGLRLKLAGATNLAKSLRTELQQSESSLKNATQELRASTTEKSALESEVSALRVRLLHAELDSSDNFQRLTVDECNAKLSRCLEVASRLSSALRIKLEGESLERKCVICLSNPRNVYTQPCGHLILCQDCAKKVGKCPVCRSEIVRRLDVLGC